MGAGYAYDTNWPSSYNCKMQEAVDDNGEPETAYDTSDGNNANHVS